MLLHNEDDSQKSLLDAEAAKRICERLSANHLTLDFKKEFKDFVIKDFIDKYKNGLTPNPCIECNKNIKFGQMLEKALECGCDYIATGHYARIQEKNGRYLLLKAKDLSKDQSYVLYPLSQYQLSKSVFPLGLRHIIHRLSAQ